MQLCRFSDQYPGRLTGFPKVPSRAFSFDLVKMEIFEQFKVETQDLSHIAVSKDFQKANVSHEDYALSEIGS